MTINFQKLREDEVRSEGALAFEEGKSIHSCPYKIGWDEYCWKKGYKDAEEEWVLAQSDFEDEDEYYD